MVLDKQINCINCIICASQFLQQVDGFPAKRRDIAAVRADFGRSPAVRTIKIWLVAYFYTDFFNINTSFCQLLSSPITSPVNGIAVAIEFTAEKAKYAAETWSSWASLVEFL